MKTNLSPFISLFIFFALTQNIFAEKLVYPYTFAPSEGFVNKLEKENRQEICLNAYWDFMPVELPAGYVQGKGAAPELPLPKSNAYDETRIKIPSPWNINSFANRNLEGPDHRNYPSYPQTWEHVKMAWMKKTLTIPADWNDKTIKIHFEAVAGFAEVYVNRQKVAENFDLFLPFDADISNVAKPGETVEILVGVRSQALFEDNSTVGRRIVPGGSMWGYHINGIWQDVYLLALPKIYISDVFIKPQVSKNQLELEIEIQNNSVKKENITLTGFVKEWINRAGTDVNFAPVPNWKLGNTALNIPEKKINIDAGEKMKISIAIPVVENALDFWTPENPNLYGLILSLNNKKQTIDTKYERFGWREWTVEGTKQCLNGKPYQLRSDSWHFMGVPQMTRRYAWAWFSAIKGMNGNAVRPHAQVYPRFYLDMADEMGICVLDETSIWASDGGPKMDSPAFWEACKEHIRRLVLRDRNHASVFGWSISNENKPVILHVFNKPELMKYQEQAWKDWSEIVKQNDPTRPWISSDGEDDGNGVLPVTVGHYGDMNSMKHWEAIGKPWGIGEHSMAYYGTPEQVSKYNGEEAYESQLGRMKGLANECYHLIKNQRDMGASYVSVFNMAWYALKPLPLGKKDLTTAPSLTDDGVFFAEYKEGLPCIQPERVGPYCTTFNPGYDPSLPLYDAWPMYDAMRSANAFSQSAWSPYETISNQEKEKNTVSKQYNEVFYLGEKGSALNRILSSQGVKLSAKIAKPQQAIYIVDGTYIPTEKETKELKKKLAQGSDIWIWGITPQTQDFYNRILPLPLRVDERRISSFIPVQKSWMRELRNSDFYFCEIQRTDASQYGLSGTLVEEGEVLLNACATDWRKWNKRPEEIKTASTIRSEYEYKGPAPAFVKYQQGVSRYFVSTLTEFTNSEKGYNTLASILKNAGIPAEKPQDSLTEVFFLRDGEIYFPDSSKEKFELKADAQQLNLWVWSSRPLDDLLIEPNMPKLSLFVETPYNALLINDKTYSANTKTADYSNYIELPLQQGWNKLSVQIGTGDRERFKAIFRCENNKDFLSLLKFSFVNPE